MEVRSQWSNIFKGLRVEKVRVEVYVYSLQKKKKTLNKSRMMPFIDIHRLKDFITSKFTQQEKLRNPSRRRELTSDGIPDVHKEMKEKRHGICIGKYMLFYYQLNLVKNMEQFKEK